VLATLRVDRGPIVNDDMSTSRTYPTATLITSVLLAAPAMAQGTGRWTSGAAMPSERTEVAVAEVGGKIYLLGGFRGELELEIYSPATDRWSRCAAIPRAVHHAAAVGAGAAERGAACAPETAGRRAGFRRL
jgi:hypothetical protein